MTTARVDCGALHPVLVGTTAELTGAERLLAAWSCADELCLIVETGRSSNLAMLEASTVFVHDRTGVVEWTSAGRRDLTGPELSRLRDLVEGPLGESLEVLRLVEPARRDARPRLVVLLDGSDRGAEALEPARRLAELTGLDLSPVCVSGARAERSEPAAAVEAIAASGDVPVTSAFGRWSKPAQLYGVLPQQVHRNAPVIIGVGPNAAGDTTERPGPVLVAVDGSAHARHVVTRLGWLRFCDRPVVIAHVRKPGDATDDHGAAERADAEVTRIAALIAAQWGLDTSVETVAGADTCARISELVEYHRSPLAVLHSWHRPADGHPLLASVSLAAVDRLRCPVAVVSDPKGEGPTL